MSRHNSAVAENESSTRPLSIRLPKRLNQQLDEIASRYAQTRSAVVKRFIAVGLKAEQQAERRG